MCVLSVWYARDGAKKKIHVKNVKKAASLALLDLFF